MLDNTKFGMLPGRQIAVEMRAGRHVAKGDGAPPMGAGVGRRAMHHERVMQADLARFENEGARLCLVISGFGQFLVKGIGGAVIALMRQQLASPMLAFDHF